MTTNTTDYEDDLTRMLRPAHEIKRHMVGELVLAIKDMRVRLEIVKMLKQGVEPYSIAAFQIFLNQNVSHDEFAYYQWSLPLARQTLFKERLSEYFVIEQPHERIVLDWEPSKPTQTL